MNAEILKQMSFGPVKPGGVRVNSFNEDGVCLHYNDSAPSGYLLLVAQHVCLTTQMDVAITPEPTDGLIRIGNPTAVHRYRVEQGKRVLCHCLKDPTTTPAYIRRPPNAWVLFRKYTGCKLRRENPNITASEISKVAGKRWDAMTDAEMEPWNELAEGHLEEHKFRYPDYDYTNGGVVTPDVAQDMIARSKFCEEQVAKYLKYDPYEDPHSTIIRYAELVDAIKANRPRTFSST